MKKLTSVISISLFVMLSTSTSKIHAQLAPKTYIVLFKQNATARRSLPDMANQIAAQVNGRVRHVYQNTIQGMAVEISESALAGLRNNPSVEVVEADQTVQLIQPRAATQPTSVTIAATQSIPWGITRVGGFGDGTGKTAWVIDTGIDLRHPDLRVDSARCFSAFRGTFTFEALSGCNDGNGHGTHVAGTIAALNNTVGVVGVAAGATVVPVKVLNSSGSGSNSGVIAGIDYVAQNARAGDVANMSLGGGTSAALDAAVTRAAARGIKFTLAAGNSSQNANNSSPARVNGANIFTISAFAQGNTFASFSNFGNPPIDYAAPGVNITSTWKNGGYNTISGTSMASPHAAGILLLGLPNTNGTVTGDRDSTPDLIIVR
jgi:subtilisin family serine protease